MTAYKNKYQRQKQQYSTDGGRTWQDVVPANYQKGTLLEEASSDCNTVEWREVADSWFCSDTDTLTRWINNGLFQCDDGNKYYEEKEQQSTDGGTTWTDTGNVRLGALAEYHSSYCGYVEPLYRWVVVPNDYVCNGVDKYRKEEEQYSVDNGETWQSTQMTRQGTIIEHNSDDCGYSDLQYQWVEDGNYVCDCFDKYAQEKEQVYINGVWTDNGNTRKGTRKIEADSSDCGYIPLPAIYRWAVVPNEYICDGTRKYEKKRKQQSTDGGHNWVDVSPVEEERGDFISIDTDVCGYEDKYLRTTALESGTITFRIPPNVTTTNVPSISYSTDNGETWTTTNNTSSLVMISLNVTTNQEVLWRASAQKFGINSTYYCTFGGTARFNVDGNVMSLCYSDNFIGQTTLNKYYQFECLFRGSKVVDASNLVLPATRLSDYCYQYMFSGCTSLTTAPQLPATTLAFECYYHMFNGCTSLTTGKWLLFKYVLRLYIIGYCTSINCYYIGK